MADVPFLGYFNVTPKNAEAADLQPITVELSDYGKTLAFPGDATQDEIQAVIDRDYPMKQAAAAQAPKPSLMDQLRPPEALQQEPLWKTILGIPQSVGEGMLAGASGLASMPLASVAEALTAGYQGMTGNPQWQEAGKKAYEDVAGTLTYQPETPLAQYGLQVASAPFTMAGQLAEDKGGYWGGLAARDVMGALPLKGMTPKIPAHPAAQALQKTPPEMTERYQLAQQEGLPVSPSAIRPSKAASAVETVIGKTPVLEAFTNRYRKQVADAVIGKMEEIRGKYANREAIASFDDAVDAMYGQAIDNVKVKAVPMKRTFEYLDQLAEKKLLSKNALGIVEELKLTAGETGELPIDVIGRLKRQLSSIAGTKGKDIKRNIFKRMLDDIAEVPGGEEAGKALADIDKQYMFNKKSRQIQSILDSAATYDAGQFVEPKKFLNTYAKQRDMLKRSVPEAVKALDELADIMRLTQKDLEAYKKYEQRGAGVDKLLTAMLGAGAGIGSVFAPGTIPTAAGLTGGGMLLSRSAMRPTGLVKRTLLGKRPPLLGAE